MTLSMYHGCKKPFEKFSYSFVGQGNDEEGVGFYLTNNETDARRYGDTILVVEAAIRKLVPTVTGSPPRKEILSLMKKSPDIKTALMDWDENPHKALAMASSSIFKHDDTPHKAFLSVWWDFYRNHPIVYLQNMVKMGYDGVLIQKKEGVSHLVAFDPDKLKIIGKVLK